MTMQKEGDMHSVPHYCGTYRYNPWFCGVCGCPLVNYGITMDWKSCPTCGCGIDDPGLNETKWVRISIKESNEGIRRQYAILHP